MVMVVRGKDSTNLAVVVSVILFLAGSLGVLFAVHTVGYVGGVRQMQRDAIVAGKAEYYSDENGIAVWRWKP